MNWRRVPIIAALLAVLSTCGCVVPPTSCQPAPIVESKPHPRVKKRAAKPALSSLSQEEKQRLYLKFLQDQLEKQHQVAVMLGILEK